MLQFKVDKEKCVKCGSCIDDCPANIIDFLDDYPAIPAEKEEKCIACQHCFAVCPEGAISIFGLDPTSALQIAGNMPAPKYVETLIKGRRSVRRYSTEPIDRTTIDGILNVIAHCPTGKNNRQTLFTVVDDATAMAKVKGEIIEVLRQLADQKSLPSGMEFFEGVVKAWDKGRDVIFRGAPHMLIASSPKSGPTPQADAVIALTSFDLLAQSMGIGTVWNGFLHWILTVVSPGVSRRLGIPDDHIIGYAMVFGKPAVQYHRCVLRGPAKINRVSRS
ncbi:MAG TPA: nitroreductase family protein [Dissulfurispiraceae bacterium]|nr:nitroreductase family protein [Dissulfurispiraceae bacterium]